MPPVGEPQLTPIEFQLRICCGDGGRARRRSKDAFRRDSRSAVASDYPDEENVRSVVKRLRRVLSEADANGILANEPGRYYFSCPVRLS
jgi:hypothetical protein